MPDEKLFTISCAVEGLVDEALINRLGNHLNVFINPVYGKKGKNFLKEKIEAYNNAARFNPWIVLIDLDNDFECAPPLIQSWLPGPGSNLNLRVAVRAVEAWILADRERLAKFLNVKVLKIPTDPETVPDPKLAVVNLARQSRKSSIRKDMVPRPASGRKVGPAYTSRLIDFIGDTQNGWRPDVAAWFSDSLNRCIRSIRGLMSKFT